MKLVNAGLLSRALVHFHLLLLLTEKGFPADVRFPPDITLGPEKEILFRDGDTFRLDCVSNGHPKPWFEWKKDGRLVDPNDNSIRWVQPEVTGTIEISKADKARTGYYQCRTINQYGVAMSNVSFVQMAWLDRYPITGIQSYYRREGEDLMLPCQNLNSVPSSIFSWALVTSIDDKHPTPYTESDRVRIDESGNLHFAYVKKEDEYNQKLYKCQIFNPILDITQGVSFANLSTTAASPIPTSAPRPAFKTRSPLVGLVGGAVDMSCQFYGNPVPKVTWQKSGGSLPSVPRWKLDPSSYNTEVHIDKLEMGDEGDYICTGTSSSGASSSTITLRVEAEPSFVLGDNHLSSRTVAEGESLTYTCIAEAIPTPVITWLRNGVSLQVLPPKYRLSADGLSLTISDLCKNCPDGSSDLTVIQCNASNVHGYVFAQGSVNVIVKTAVVDNSLTVFWRSEEEFLFPCFASFDAAVVVASATYSWFLNNGQLVFSNSVWFDRNNSFLHVKTGSDLEEDRQLLGTYRCEVTDGYSRDFVEHHLLSQEEDENVNECKEYILVIIVAILSALLLILAIGATLYGCRQAKKKRDKRCRCKTKADDSAIWRPPSKSSKSSNESDESDESDNKQ